MRYSLEDVAPASLRNYPDINGNLAFLEGERDVPFKIARVFYVFGVHHGDVRGQHAHRACHQFLVCVHGRVTVDCDDGKDKKTFTLDSPLVGLHIPPTIWAEQRYASSASMLLVLADRPFDEADYIRDRRAFLKFRGADGKR